MQPHNSLAGRPAFVSWSGGKDSCLALYRAVQQGLRPQCLFTMLSEEGERSRSHALPVGLLERQAAALGLPLVTAAASWADYEATFVATLRELRLQGIEVGVFGDIDLQPHREWEERVCAAAGMEACLPLWQRARRELLDEMLGLGFEAAIVTVNLGRLDARFLGRRLDAGLIEELEAAGSDACGENGEYHTVVTGGPLFREPVRLEVRETVTHEGYGFLMVG